MHSGHIRSLRLTILRNGVIRMAIALLKEIASIEEQADQIEAQALQNARDIVASARRDAANAAEKADEQAELDAKKVIKAESEKAHLKIKEMQAETEAQCKIIKKNAKKNLNAAVDIIFERVVKQ